MEELKVTANDFGIEILKELGIKHEMVTGFSINFNPGEPIKINVSYVVLDEHTKMLLKKLQEYNIYLFEKE